MQLESSSFYASIVPIALGGVLSYFKHWLGSDDDIRKRAQFKKDTLLEEINKRLQRLFIETQRATFDLPELRGGPPARPDLIGDYTSQVDRSSTAVRKLFKIHSLIKACWTTLLATVAVSLVGFLASLVWIWVRPYVSIVCLIIVVVQLMLVFIVRRLVTRFEECEAL
jgi:ABC-type multidrug transport system fused ATPase/permease subunit